MEEYLEIIEFVKVHRDIGLKIPAIQKELLDTFEFNEYLKVDISDNIVDIIYKAQGERLVSATSIFIENE
ncbi:MAG: hypothetical protein KUG81_09005 [Gammaproteobacteria bacterium]|nr:hypothetical protein [Gammaproteobacteria bacterium]